MNIQLKDVDWVFEHDRRILLIEMASRLQAQTCNPLSREKVEAYIDAKLNLYPEYRFPTDPRYPLISFLSRVPERVLTDTSLDVTHVRSAVGYANLIVKSMGLYNYSLFRHEDPYSGANDSITALQSCLSYLEFNPKERTLIVKGVAVDTPSIFIGDAASALSVYAAVGYLCANSTAHRKMILTNQSALLYFLLSTLNQLGLTADPADLDGVATQLKPDVTTWAAVEPNLTDLQAAADVVIGKGSTGFVAAKVVPEGVLLTSCRRKTKDVSVVCKSTWRPIMGEDKITATRRFVVELLVHGLAVSEYEARVATGMCSIAQGYNVINNFLGLYKFIEQNEWPASSKLVLDCMPLQ